MKVTIAEFCLEYQTIPKQLLLQLQPKIFIQMKNLIHQIILIHTKLLTRRTGDEKSSHEIKDNLCHHKNFDMITFVFVLTQ